MNITEKEIQSLREAATEDAWNKVCDDIKKVRDQQYPPDWYSKVVLSGLMQRVSSKWG